MSHGAVLCVYYQRTKNYAFSFDRVLSFKGNSAVFLLYAVARINVSINITSHACACCASENNNCCVVAHRACAKGFVH